MTQPGIILGTAPYMSPEQAKGEAVDKRTDIWAFGCILFECLTGLMAFSGDSVSEAMAAILKEEPDWGRLPQNLPEDCEKLVKRCLRKVLDRRLQSIGDARVELLDLLDRGFGQDGLEKPQETSKKKRSTLTKTIPLAVVVVSAALLGVFASRLFFDPEQTGISPQASRFPIDLPSNQHVHIHSDAQHLVISRDGSRLAWIGKTDGRLCLYTRKLNELEIHSIPGTEDLEDSSNVFLSPDGAHAGFIREGAVLTIPIEGGVATPVYDSGATGNVYAADWGDDGSIIFASPDSGLKRIPPEGGIPEEITRLKPDKGEVGHGWLSILPGSRGVLLIVSVGNYNDNHLEVLSLDSGLRKDLVSDAGIAQYISTGHLLYHRGATLYARPFDLQSLDFIGNEVPVLQDVQLETSLGRVADFSVSENGNMVYIPAGQGFGERKMIWRDRDHNIQELEGLRGGVSSPRMSPRGDQIAYTRRVGNNSQINVYDLSRKISSQVTTEGSGNNTPVWSPEGETLTFLSNKNGQFNLYAKSVLEDTDAVHLIDSPNLQWPTSWSPHGNVLIVVNRKLHDTQNDVWLLELDKDPKELIPFLNSRAMETQARFSPDGKWIAYVSNEENPEEDFYDVFIRRNPMLEGESPGKRKVSRQGGCEPVWSRTGDELFYRSLDGKRIYSVDVRSDDGLQVGEERIVLDNLNLPGFFYLFNNDTHYDVSRDGKFLMTVELDRPEIMRIVVVQNWFEELRRLVPSKK